MNQCLMSHCWTTSHCNYTVSCSGNRRLARAACWPIIAMQVAYTSAAAAMTDLAD